MSRGGGRSYVSANLIGGGKTQYAGEHSSQLRVNGALEMFWGVHL